MSFCVSSPVVGVVRVFGAVYGFAAISAYVIGRMWVRFVVGVTDCVAPFASSVSVVDLFVLVGIVGVVLGPGEDGD
eukprot:4348103-Prorocentrum_lima.AAC.1